MASVTEMREHPFECVFWKKMGVFNLKKVVRRQDFKKRIFFIDGTYYLLRWNFKKK